MRTLSRTVGRSYYPALLLEELEALAGASTVDLTGMLDGRLANDGDISIVFDEVVTPVADMEIAVQNTITNHVADPGPGPVGLTSEDLDQAWASIGRQVAVGTASLDLFRQDAAAFNTALEAALAGGVGQEEINRRLAWMLYASQRFLGMPRPLSYDPFNEATVVMADDGTLTWAAIGPPW